MDRFRAAVSLNHLELKKDYQDAELAGLAKSFILCPVPVV